MDSRSQPYASLKSTYVALPHVTIPNIYVPPSHENEDKEKDEEKYQTLSNRSPEVWGPHFWFTLHNGALNYPSLANPLCIERMKNFILGIPVMIPCETCKEHATGYIEQHKEYLDYTCSGREKLFKFFVDFHNIVNVRLNKPEMSLDDAYRLYDK
jgi:hypothetical protein